MTVPAAGVGDQRAAAAEAGSATVWRIRAAAVCVALTALAFLQEPGMTVVDTKVDLTAAPVAWLERALHAWEPTGTFGQLQNQAYGYLWPMGPVFAAGWWLSIPGWVVQRLWWALLMCLAFTGVVRLAGRLAIGTPTSRIIAGVAFALSPRILTELGPISVEAWPSAIAPWVLVPLIPLAHGAALRPAVARSALAVACAGGVNATAVLAVVPLAALWLVTLRPLRRRLAALVAWGLAVGLATAWWVVPLLILGRYSPPFLDYIETAQVTTAPTDLVSVLRGASHWHAYLTGVHGPAWDAGWRLATSAALIVATLVVAGLGVAGLARRGIPHRRFLLPGLLVGLALVGFGHAGAVNAALAAAQQEFLDGAGAPLRNVHKFDVVLRLPLVLGMAHLLGVLARAAAARPQVRAPRLRAAGAVALALAAVAGVASPALAGDLPIRGSYRDVPGYWHQATDWLDSHLGDDRALVVPAARFPRYLWGSPTDEMTQPLMESPWGVRSSIPLTPPATIRLLDAVESALADGAGSPGLADLLARSGVRYLLVRADLDHGRSGSARPLVIRQALARSPGITPVKAFGPRVGGGHLPGTFVDRGMDVPVRALEVFQVERSVSQVVAYDVADVTTVVGGPESVLALAAAGQVGRAPTVLAGDAPPELTAGRLAVTDGLRRREVAFGLATDNASATMGADDPLLLDAPAHDYLPDWAGTAAGHATVVRYRGVAGVRASSSMAQALPVTGSRPEFQPYAAIDGDPQTAWRSARGTVAAGQWLEIRLAAPRRVTQVRLAFDQGADSIPTEVTVAAGGRPVTVAVEGSSGLVRLPGAEPTSTVRITVKEVLDVRAGFGGVGFAEVTIPGVRAERTLVVPPVRAAGSGGTTGSGGAGGAAQPGAAQPGAAQPGPAARPVSSLVFTAAPSVPSCFFLDGRPFCSPALARASEDGHVIDRTATLPATGRYAPSLWVRPRPGPALTALLDQPQRTVRATASSTATPDPAARPGVVVDGDPFTTWQAAQTDAHPWLRLSWPARREVTGIRLTLDQAVAAARPWAVTVMGDDGVRGGVLDEDGTVTFDQPLRTDELTVLFADVSPAGSYHPYENRFEQLPVGVGELTALPAEPQLYPEPGSVVRLPCGSGPTLSLGGVRRRTAVTATRRDLLELREVRASVCPAAGTAEGAPGPVRLPAGAVALRATGSATFDPVRLALSAERAAPDPSPSPVRVLGWAPTERRLAVRAAAGDRVLALRENTNPGWQATIGGQTLQPIVVDGWQQGWLLPAAAAGEVTLTFAPDAAYRGGLFGGGLLALVVLAAAVVPARRRRPDPAAAGGPAEGFAVPAWATVTGRPVRGRPPATLRPGRPFLATAVGAVALISVGGLATIGVALFGLGAMVAYRALLANLDRIDQRQTRRVQRLMWRWLPVALFAVAGTWSLLADERRSAAGPQLVALALAGVLWLSVAVRAFHRRPGPRQPG